MWRKIHINLPVLQSSPLHPSIPHPTNLSPVSPIQTSHSNQNYNPKHLPQPEHSIQLPKMQFSTLLLTTLTLLGLSIASPIGARQSTAGGSTGAGTIIPDPPNGVECTGDSNGVTIGDIVGNLVDCGGVGGLLGGK